MNKNLQIAVSHPTANVFSVALVSHMIACGSLHTFWTSIAWSKENPLLKRLPNQLRHQFERRAFERDIVAHARTHPIREWGRLISAGVGLKELYQNESSLFSIDRVFKSLDHRVSAWLEKEPYCDAIYAYEDGSIESFITAGKHGIFKIYDLPIAYWSLRQSLYKEEQERRPDWTKNLHGMHDSNMKLETKTREAQISDLIVCPSDFVKNSIPEDVKSPEKILVVPFGSPLDEGIEPLPKVSLSEPLKILFVATLSQRKGLADLFDAVALLPKNSVELHAVGLLEHDLEFYHSKCDCLLYHGTMPRQSVLKQMREADVFVLPSIAEGRALVTQEALSQGLPLIITANTGADDLIEEEKNGFVVPIRDPRAIADKINWFLEHRQDLPEMKKFAQKSVQKFTWGAYGASIVEGIFKHLDES